jgi:hypothetical protein
LNEKLFLAFYDARYSHQFWSDALERMTANGGGLERTLWQEIFSFYLSPKVLVCLGIAQSASWYSKGRSAMVTYSGSVGETYTWDCENDLETSIFA